jgi:hypothetical protein
MYAIESLTTRLSHLTILSRKDPIATQQKITRRKEAAMATFRQAMVRRMYDSDHWQFTEGRHKYGDGRDYIAFDC